MKLEEALPRIREGLLVYRRGWKTALLCAGKIGLESLNRRDLLACDWEFADTPLKRRWLTVGSKCKEVKK